tara:strand:- start:700 stop:1035 length:336 start_codon:yes stop_codon:yes gene_type:complete
MSFKSQDTNNNSFDVTTEGSRFTLSQDINAYRQYAKESRDLYEVAKKKSHYRSFAIIPDIVAIDILTKYQIDINASDFMSDKALVARLKRIIISEYPDLLTHGHSRRQQKV